MPNALTDKVALVTGGSRGIGAAIARRLAADGARVVLNYGHHEGPALAVVAQIEARGGQAICVPGDLSRLESIPPVIGAALERFGRLDILVNNAAAAPMVPWAGISPELYSQTMDLNIRAPLFLSQKAARHMAAGGRIINISSEAARGALPGSVVYASSKAALETMTRVLSVELARRGITVNAVAPGAVETEALRESLGDHVRDELVRRTPLGRVGTPEDIADVVAFLASEDSRWVTGQTIVATGGLR